MDLPAFSISLPPLSRTSPGTLRHEWNRIATLRAMNPTITIHIVAFAQSLLGVSGFGGAGGVASDIGKVYLPSGAISKRNRLILPFVLRNGSPRSIGLKVEPMQVSESIQCPFCGQAFEVLVDTSVASQRFTTDCEICCRPIEITVECEPGEVLTLSVG